VGVGAASGRRKSGPSITMVAFQRRKIAGGKEESAPADSVGGAEQRDVATECSACFSFEPITRGNNVSASCCNRSTTVLKHQHHFTTVRVDEAAFLKSRFFGAYAVPIIRARPPISAVSSVIRARSAALMSGTRFAKRRTYPVLAAICPFSSPDVFQRIVITLSLGLGAC
jgi:hypothetical protein